MKSSQALRLSAGIVPVWMQEKPLYLVLRAYNCWDFPKGIVEKDEMPLVAAIRELREETSLERVEFPWGEEFIETEPYNHKIARYYLGKVFSRKVFLPVNPVLGRPEHHEFRWRTYDEARTLLVPRLQRVLDWAQALI